MHAWTVDGEIRLGIPQSGLGRDHLKSREGSAVEVCTVWGASKGQEECTLAVRVRSMRKECGEAEEEGGGLEGAMEKKVNRLVRPGPVREAIMAPWRLDSAGRPPNAVEVMVEVEAALGTVLGAETPTEGFRRPVSRQRAGAVIAGDSRAGTGGV